MGNINLIMIKNEHCKAIILGLLLLLSPMPCLAISAESGPVFFIGEDIIHPKGIVLSVNEISRKPYTEGLGNSAKKDDLGLNLTIVNNGRNDQVINVMKDFSLDMGPHHYKPLENEFSRVKVETITVGAGTQSRIDLTFRVSSEEKSAPELIFKFDDANVRIVCDEKLGKIVSESNTSFADNEDIAKAAKLLVDAGRLTAAKNLCESALIRNPNDTQFLLLMAKIYSKVEEDDQTAYYLRRIDVTKMSGADEAEEAAIMANSIGYSDVAVSILTSFYDAGLLNDDQKALLARAYYYENELKPAISILNHLFASGYNKPKALFTMGNIYNKSMDYEQAIYYWEKAVEGDPECSEALFNIGVGYYKLGDLNKARNYWYKVLQSNPDSATMSAAEDALRETDY
jgi:tetratricopeptide (TPR) repeat protein